VFAVLLSVLVGGCATYEGSDQSYGGYGGGDCQAIASDPYAQGRIPSGCYSTRPFRR
jgi:hypothetical protein